MIRIGVGAIFAATIFASGAHAEDWNWLSFSKANALNAGHFQVDVSSVRRDGRLAWSAKRVEWLAVNGVSEQTTWADSDTCPAMMLALAKFQSIKPFTIVPPRLQNLKAPVEVPMIVADGATFQIHAKVHWTKESPLGEILLTGNYHTPVADLIQETMNALAPCWSKERPSI